MVTTQQTLKNKNGFTLVELLVVIAIIGILLSGAVTSFNSSRNRQDLMTTAVRIENVFKEARNNSIVGLKGMDLGILSAPGYGIYIDGVSDPQVITYFIDNDQDKTFNAGDTTIETITLDKNIHINDMYKENPEDIEPMSATIVYVPPRGLALVQDTIGSIDELHIIIGVDDEDDVNTSFATDLTVTSGGGKIDLKLY